MNDFQERISKLVTEGVVPAEQLNERIALLNLMQEHQVIFWTFGFCKDGEPDQHDWGFEFIQKDEKELAKILALALIIKQHEAIILEHCQVLLQKRHRLTYTDEYGDTIKAKWIEELKKYYKNKLLPNLYSSINNLDDDAFSDTPIEKDVFLLWMAVENDRIARAICSMVDIYLNKISGSVQQDVSSKTGLEYEVEIIDLINTKTNWSAVETSSTGDQGADIIIQKPHITGVVQVKYYSGKIGNGAIQEAYAAKKYYGADFAFVVCNSGYTKSAYALADKTSVKILTTSQLIDALQ